jgi:heme-degrading monooxygenase HmoA
MIVMFTRRTFVTSSLAFVCLSTPAFPLFSTLINQQKEASMLLIRDVFRCKPGKSRQVADMFKKTIPSLEKMDGFNKPRVLLDFVADYWTVVLESEVDSLERFESHMTAFSTRPEVREALSGYMDLVEGGKREIYKIV